MEASSSTRRWGAAWLAALSLLLGIVGGLGGAVVAIVLFEGDADAPPPTAATPAVGVAERMAAEAAPSVVTIISETSRRREGGRIVQETSLGSGVIIDRRGFIVTNEHVIRGASRLTVVFDSGEQRRGALVSHDAPFTDLAVVKVEGGGEFPALPLGDSDALRLGQPLVSIGHSLRDFPTSVTSGLVSGLHRDWARENVVMEDMIQTDAAINHGNSGGALLNERGEVVGISTTVVRETESGEAVEGIALAIASKTIRDVAIPIIEQGRKPRPTLGIEARDVSPELAAANGLQPVQAALVTTVASGGPADRGGMRLGDLIVAAGGTELTRERPYLNVLMRLPIDRPIEVRVLRNGVPQTLNITPVAR